MDIWLIKSRDINLRLLLKILNIDYLWNKIYIEFLIIYIYEIRLVIY